MHSVHAFSILFTLGHILLARADCGSGCSQPGLMNNPQVGGCGQQGGQGGQPAVNNPLSPAKCFNQTIPLPEKILDYKGIQFPATNNTRICDSSQSAGETECDKAKQ